MITKVSFGFHSVTVFPKSRYFHFSTGIYVPGTDLGTGNSFMNKIHKAPVFMEPHV